MRKEAIQFFDRYDEPIRSIIIFAYELHHSSADIIKKIELFLSCIALFINLFHLLILSKKALRSSGITVLMIGLAVNDIICFSIVLYPHTTSIFKNDYDKCSPPSSYASLLLLDIENYLYQISRRISPWLGVFMAFIRLLISSYPFNNTIAKMANPPFAVWSLIFCFSINVLIWTDFFVIGQIEVLTNWIPNKSCGFPKNYSQPVYIIHSYGEIDSQIYVGRVFDRIRIVLKHLPIIILPVLTIGLIIVLRKINASKQRLQRNIKETSYQTTRLVTIMTCCLVITEWATGLVEITPTFLSSQSPLVILIHAFNIYFLLLFSLNSMAHCFITMLLSSQYRTCSREVFPCLRIFEKKSNTTSPLVSVSSIKNGIKQDLRVVVA